MHSSIEHFGVVDDSVSAEGSIHLMEDKAATCERDKIVVVPVAYDQSLRIGVDSELVACLSGITAQWQRNLTEHLLIVVEYGIDAFAFDGYGIDGSESGDIGSVFLYDESGTLEGEDTTHGFCLAALLVNTAGGSEKEKGQYELEMFDKFDKFEKFVKFVKFEKFVKFVKFVEFLILRNDLLRCGKV